MLEVSESETVGLQPAEMVITKQKNTEAQKVRLDRLFCPTSVVSVGKTFVVNRPVEIPPEDTRHDG